jgi:uncharacterized membrane protein YcjF (UPF0283 family)
VDFIRFLASLYNNVHNSNKKLATEGVVVAVVCVVAIVVVVPGELLVLILLFRRRCWRRSGSSEVDEIAVVLGRLQLHLPRTLGHLPVVLIDGAAD